MRLAVRQTQLEHFYPRHPGNDYNDMIKLQQTVFMFCSRRGTAGFTRARRGQSVGDFIKIIKAGNLRNSRG